MTANSALFCAIDISWPLHCAQPFGAKVKPKLRISPIKGSAMAPSSTTRRENALEGDDETDAERGHQIGVRLVAAGGPADARRQSDGNRRGLALLRGDIKLGRIGA